MNSISSIHQAFQKKGITLDLNDAQLDIPIEVSKKQIQQIVHEAGYCAIIGSTQFTVVPYRTDLVPLSPYLNSLFRESNNLLAAGLRTFPTVYVDHFAHNKRSMLAHASDLTGRAVIFGFGNGDDVPLVELATQFSEVTLVDADITGMQNTVRKLPAHLQERMKPIQMDLTGIISLLHREFKKLERNAEIQTVLSLIEKSLVHAADLPSLGKFDFVVSTMLTSQLYAFVEKLAMEHFPAFPSDFFDLKK